MRGLWVVVLLIGCEESSSVTGRVVQHGAPVANARVELGDAVTMTAADGTFLLDNLEVGSRELIARRGDEVTAFEEQRRPIDIAAGENDIGELVLPRPVDLAAIPHTKTVELAWTPAAAEGFVDYQLYRGWQGDLQPGSDYRIHTTTVADETSYLDGALRDGTISPESTLYYRLFSRDAVGGRAASTTLEVRTPEWDETELSERWELAVDSSFAGQAAIGGIAWDGAALWLAYRTQVGGYYDPDQYTLVRRDLATGATLATLSFDDLYAAIAGLAWDGTSLWMAFAATEQNGVRRIDPETGAVLGQLGLPGYTRDIDWDGERLVRIDDFATATVIDPTSGATLDTFDVPFANSTRGIASRDGDLWTISWTNDDIAILGADGVQVGYAHTDLYALGWWYESGLAMTFVGDRLALVVENSVYLLDLVAAP